MNRQNMIKFLKSLNINEAAEVLETLLDDHPDLLKKAYDVAVKVTTDVDADEIAISVYQSLNSLDVEDLYSRSGKTRYGYVEPCEEAYVMLEEAIDPFINEMMKNQQRELPAISKTFCIGIINGLRRYAKESRTDFSEYIEEDANDYVYTVVEEWKKGKPPNEDIVEVATILNS